MRLTFKYRFVIPDFIATRFVWGKHESNLALQFKPKLKIFSWMSMCFVFYKYMNPTVIPGTDGFVPFKNDVESKEKFKQVQLAINPSENNQ